MRITIVLLFGSLLCSGVVFAQDSNARIVELEHQFLIWDRSIPAHSPETRIAQLEAELRHQGIPIPPSTITTQSHVLSFVSLLSLLIIAPLIMPYTIIAIASLALLCDALMPLSSLFLFISLLQI